MTNPQKPQQMLVRLSEEASQNIRKSPYKYGDFRLRLIHAFSQIDNMKFEKLNYGVEYIHQFTVTRNCPQIEHIHQEIKVAAMAHGVSMTQFIDQMVRQADFSVFEKHPSPTKHKVIPLDTRWTAKKKGALVMSILQGKVTLAQATETYKIPLKTLNDWVSKSKNAVFDALVTKKPDASSAGDPSGV